MEIYAIIGQATSFGEVPGLMAGVQQLQRGKYLYYQLAFEEKTHKICSVNIILIIVSWDIKGISD